VPAYLLANVRVTNPEAYAEYSRQVPATVAAHGGRFLVRGGPGEVVEGEFSLQRLVIIEFPDRDRLRAWYDSPEYQAIYPSGRRMVSRQLSSWTVIQTPNWALGPDISRHLRHPGVRRWASLRG